MKSWWLGASLVLAAALAACSGNLGGGSSTLPGTGASPISQVAQPTATPTPLQANSIATYGDPRVVGPQPLPTIQGYGGTITFPTPNPSSTPKGGQEPVAIGLTAGIAAPTDAPVFDPSAEARKHNFLLGLKGADKSAPIPLFFISLVSTSDVTLHELPKIAIDVPRDIVLKYRSGAFGLALFDPSKKSKHYDLAVAEIDSTSPAPLASALPQPSPSPSASSSASPSPGPTLRPGQPATLSPTVAPKASPTLPPQRIAFKATATELQLVANRPVVFALYAIPAPKPSPSQSPKPSAKGHASPEPSPAASGSPSITTSPVPAGSSSPSSITSPESSPSPASSGRP